MYCLISHICLCLLPNFVRKKTCSKQNDSEMIKKRGKQSDFKIIAVPSATCRLFVWNDWGHGDIYFTRHLCQRKMKMWDICDEVTEVSVSHGRCVRLSTTVTNTRHYTFKRWNIYVKTKKREVFLIWNFVMVLVSSFRFFWIPMLWVFDHYKCFIFSVWGSTIDVRIWRLKTVPALKGLKKCRITVGSTYTTLTQH